MTEHQQAFDRLRQVNPVAVRHIEDRPDALEMLSMAQGTTAALTEPERGGRKWQLGPAVAVAMFALILLLGIPFLIDESDTGPVTDTAISSPVEPLPQTGPLAPGRYLLRNAGLPATAVFPDGLEIVASQPGFIDIEPLLYPSEVARRSLTIVRPEVLSAPSALGMETPEDGGWQLDDIAGWVETLPSGVAVESLQSTTVDGLPATRLLIEIEDAFICGSFDGCASFIRWQDGVLPLTKGSPWLIWWIEPGGDQVPLALVSSLGIDDEFIPTMDEIAQSIELG
jgi:hypothetical protein